jgi:hypothetical protein
MNLETRARGAAEGMHASTPVDAEDGLRRLHRTHRRRTVGKLIGAAVAVAVGIGVVQVTSASDRAEPPVAPTGKWVLVSGALIGTDFLPPVGDEWSKPLGGQGDHAYPYWASVDAATRRFLIYADDATALEVMTPGRAEPLVRFRCRNGLGCDFGSALGPGPDEITISTVDSQIGVIGPDGELTWPEWPFKGLGVGLLNPLAWSPDGEILAEAGGEQRADEASVTVVLRRPESAEVTTLYEYSEAAPSWYDAEEHRFGRGPGAFNGWGAPQLVDLQWAPDSTRLAFATVTTPGGDSDDRQLRWQLFVADSSTGEVDKIADLGRCTEPVDDNGQYARVCDPPHVGSASLSWAPDGETLTVLSDGSLITYDPTGKVLDSEPTDLEGPLVWMESE